MTDFHGFTGKARRLADIDLPRIGARIGVGEDELHAFMDVESAGSGFDGSGRPKMLFEPHLFYRELSGALRAKAIAAGLAYEKWGTKPYPKESYTRLNAAIALAGEGAALRSASWGATQILGSNHKAAGYASPQAMVLAFMDDEGAHLDATVSMLVSMGVAADVKAHRWATVARAWNGPGYARNHYDTKMAAAFAKWQRIKDTPWTPGRQPDDPGIAQPPETPAEPADPAPKPVTPGHVGTGAVGATGVFAILAGFGVPWQAAAGAAVFAAVVVVLILINRKG